MHFIPGSWCTLLLHRICRRCLNLLPSFPPLGRNNSQRHGRNTGRLKRKPPRHTYTHPDRHTRFMPYASKSPPKSVFKHLKLLILQKGFWLLSIRRNYKIQTKQEGTSSSCKPPLSLINVYEGWGYISPCMSECTDWITSRLHLSPLCFCGCFKVMFHKGGILSTVQSN